jgi:hypothetical protein
MSKQYLPGLRDENEPEPDVTSFVPARKQYVGTAKWWMRPILWVRRKPTTIHR